VSHEVPSRPLYFARTVCDTVVTFTGFVALWGRLLLCCVLPKHGVGSRRFSCRVWQALPNFGPFRGISSEQWRPVRPRWPSEYRPRASTRWLVRRACTTSWAKARAHRATAAKRLRRRTPTYRSSRLSSAFACQPTATCSASSVSGLECARFPAPAARSPAVN
jgi:hypothetical protein